MKPKKQSKIVWFSRSKFVAKMGPFKTQEQAFKSLVLSKDMQIRTGHVFPSEAFVWFERVKK